MSIEKIVVQGAVAGVHHLIIPAGVPGDLLPRQADSRAVTISELPTLLNHSMCIPIVYSIG
jgi:hypothetical protein